MKNRKLTSALIASALVLPVAAWGQAGGTGAGTTGTTGATTGEYQQHGQQDQWGTTGTTGAAGTTGTAGQAGATGAAGMTGTTGTTDTFGTTGATGTAGLGQDQQSDWQRQDRSAMAGQGDIKRISEDKLEQRVLASNLQGKQVVDINGEEIGEVHDVGVTYALRDVHGQDDNGDAQASVSGNIGGVSGSASVGASGDTASYGATQTSGFGLQQDSEINIFVSMDGLEDGELVSIPASQLSFDRENDRLQINQSKRDLKRTAGLDSDNDEFSTAAE